MRKFKELPKFKKVICIIAILVILSLIAQVVWYWIAGIILFSRAYKPDIVISSPDGKYEIVAREWYKLFVHGGTIIYFRKAGQDKWYNSWLKIKVGEISHDNLYHFSEGFYEIKWDEDKVTIYFPLGDGKDNARDRSTWQGELTYEFD